ncbi:MAG: hypothetical protein Q4G40_13000, partial [Brachybacterium sp.]|nr:hypothetical protein [Brachybacterium sp.]
MEGVDEFGQPVGRPVSWTPPAALVPLTTRGRTVAIAPLTPDHADAMWSALGPGRAQWTYMPADAPGDVEELRA